MNRGARSAFVLARSFLRSKTYVEAVNPVDWGAGVSVDGVSVGVAGTCRLSDCGRG